MNYKYIEIKNILENTKYKIVKKFNDLPYESIEDSIIFKGIEHLVEEIDDVIRSVRYFQKEVVNGNLYENNRGRYTFYVNSIENDELTSGTSIEIWNEEENKWEIGRIEHSGDYYFYNPYGDNISLYDGIRARKR